MMIGARGGGGGDPRLEIFVSEAKEFFSSVRAILGEGDATEARSAKINVLLEGFLKSSPRVQREREAGAGSRRRAVWCPADLCALLLAARYYQTKTR